MSAPANDNGGAGAPLAGVLERINKVQVTAELLGAVLHSQTARLPPDRSPEEAGMLRLFQLLMTEGIRPGELGLMATAIEFRLTALANLVSNDELLAWSVPRDATSPSVITPDMLQAAAAEPLVEDAEGQAAFQAESFRRRVLANTDASGQA